MAPLLVVIGAFKWYCRRTFDDKMYYYTKGLRRTDKEALPTKPKNDRVAVRFGHPALYKKLMVPMVHEKANHILNEILHDQSDPDFGDANLYGDTYRMQRLSTHRSQQFDAAGNTTFEVVNESQMNFEHFRNREEFRDFGGDGDLFTNPADPSRSSSPTTSQYTRFNSNTSLPLNTYAAKEEDYEGATYPTGYHPPSTFRPTPLIRQYSEMSTEQYPTGRTGDLSDVDLLDDTAPLSKARSGHSYI